MTTPPAPVTLDGRLVRLEPLSRSHVPALVRAASADRSSYGYTQVPGDEAGMTALVETLLAAQADGEVVPFAQVRRADGTVVGMTRFLSLRRLPDGRLYAVEIGGTWLAAAAQRSGVNSEAKLLLMTHAFDVWDVTRVDFKTDARNLRSRAAIEGIGARFEGVLRCWQPSYAPGEEGRLRDSAVFSVTADEWPGVKEHLASRMTGAGRPA